MRNDLGELAELTGKVLVDAEEYKRLKLLEAEFENADRFYGVSREVLSNFRTKLDKFKALVVRIEPID